MRIKPNPLLAAAYLGAIVLLALAVRLEDPLSNPVIAAEDPYTHITLAREHADGSIDPLYPGSTVYPPGFHLLLAGVSASTGVSLVTLAKTFPAVLGAIGVLGTGILCWRSWGPWPAVLGSLCLALAPEAIFRTSMLSPTALDMAILPFLIMSLQAVVAGRWAAAAAAVPLAAFEAMAHPWVFGVLVTSGAAAFAFWFLRSHLPVDAARLHAGGTTAAFALVGGGFGVTMQGCWGACGPGFDQVIVLPFLGSVERLAGFVIVASAVPLAAWIAYRWWRTKHPRPPVALSSQAWRRFALAGIMAAALATMAWQVAFQGLPDHVGPRSFGWPLIALGTLGLLASPWARAPLSMLAAGLFWGTLPFVVLNPFQSPFWPHRTMVYLCLALALLAAAGLHVLLQALAQPKARTTHRRRLVAFGVAALAVAGCVTAVATQTPAPYAWYRMFSPCEDAALQESAALARADEGMLVVTGSWQAKLVLAAYATNASRIWYTPEFFEDDATRDAVASAAFRQGRQVAVVMERHTPSAGFLDDPAWVPTIAGCNGVTLHLANETPRFEARSVGNPWWVEVDVLAPATIEGVAWRTQVMDWLPMTRTE